MAAYLLDRLTGIVDRLRDRSQLLLPPQARTARGERVYAVGDIHGRMDLLLELLDKIERDDITREPRRKRLIFLGDLIDRGPHSREVVGLLREAQRFTRRLTILMGNHEAALLDSLDGDENAQTIWLKYGGLETLRSFDVDPPAPGEDGDEFAGRLKNALSPNLIKWLKNLPFSARSGSYFFCHAGIRPGVHLAQQSPDDLLWIRSEFLESNAYHGAIVVHGHSVCGPTVEVMHNRINLDTGAYQSGVLSAVGLQDTEQWVIATAPDEPDAGQTHPVQHS